MNIRFVIIEDGLTPYPQMAAARTRLAALVRSDLPSPAVIRDGLDDVVNPCDGKPYDSKSAYCRAVKEAGCVIVGNEAEKMMTAPHARSDVNADEIVDATRKVEAGYKPAPLEYEDG